MGLFDYFSREASNARRRKACLKKLSNMYYQKADRLAAAEMAADLVAEGDDLAIDVLLVRFEHLNPSSTNDQDEKRYVHDLLVDLGERVIPRIQEYVLRSDKPVYWPVRVLGSLWSRERLVSFLCEVLEQTDNGYWRDPDKKVGLVAMAADFDDPRLGKALLPFLEDADEGVRFNAITAVAERDYEGVREALLPRLAGEEESLRIHRRVVDLFLERNWSVAEQADEVAAELPAGIAVTSKKTLQRRK